MEQEPDMSKEEAVAIIGELAFRCNVMGANSSEIPDLNHLRDQVVSGAIAPKEAVKQAHQIYASKQDYH